MLYYLKSKKCAISDYSGKRNVLSDKEEIREWSVRRIERNKKHNEQYRYRRHNTEKFFVGSIIKIVIVLDTKIEIIKKWLPRYKAPRDRGRDNLTPKQCVRWTTVTLKLKCLHYIQLLLLRCFIHILE